MPASKPTTNTPSSSSSSRGGARAGTSRSRSPKTAAPAEGPHTDDLDPGQGDGHDLDHDADLDLDLDDELDDDEVEEVDVEPELVFTTTKKDRPTADEQEKIPLEVDGEIYYSVKPTDEALVFLTTASSRGLSDGDRFNAILQFCDNALTSDSSNRITQRFLDREDDFEFEDLLEVTKAIAKAWGRRKGTGKPPVRRRRRTPARRR
ncbi:hypothetical protein [Actinomadura meyerae]|nr:hypothetical protein [Actinomadura meyerae]